MTPDDPITVDVEHDPGAEEASVRVLGDVDVTTATVLAEALERVIGAGATSIAVHLGDVAFLDSTGLTTLIAARTQLEGRGRVWVSEASAPVRRVFDITGLESFLDGPNGSAAEASG